MTDDLPQNEEIHARYTSKESSNVFRPLRDVLNATFCEQRRVLEELALPFDQGPDDRRRERSADHLLDVHNGDPSIPDQMNDEEQGVLHEQSDRSIVLKPLEATEAHVHSVNEKWEQVERLLSTLRPTNEVALPSTKRLETLSMAGKLQENCTKLRSLSTRPHRSKANNSMVPTDVLQRMLQAWHCVARDRCSRRVQYGIAHGFSSRWTLKKSFRRWTRLIVRLQRERLVSEMVNDVVSARVLSHTFHQWRQQRQTTRAARIIAKLGRDARSKRRFEQWKEFLWLKQQIRTLCSQAKRRVLDERFVNWTQFAAQQKVKKARTSQARVFCLRRALVMFKAGIQISRQRRAILALVQTKTTKRVLSTVLEAWLAWLEGQRRSLVAIKWHSQSLQSKCFEAWNLLRLHSRLRKMQQQWKDRIVWQYRLARYLRLWRHFVTTTKEIRRRRTECMRKSLLLRGFRHLKSSALVDKVRHHQLAQWKRKQCIQQWLTLARSQKHLRLLVNKVARIRRRSLLNQCGLSPWRIAYQARILDRRKLVVVKNFTLRCWWRRWRDGLSAIKTTDAFNAIVDAEWMRRMKLYGIRRWVERYRHNEAQASLLLRSDEFYSRAQLQKGIRRWSDWTVGHIAVAALCSEADTHYEGTQIRKWRRRTDMIVRQAQQQHGILVDRHVQYLTRASFSLWRRFTQRNVEQRTARVFLRWCEFVQERHRSRELLCISSTLRLQRCLCHWEAFVKWQKRMAFAAHCVASRRDLTLKRSAFKKAWLSKTRRNIRLRQKLKVLLSQNLAMHVFKSWFRQVRRVKRQQRAIQWYHRCIRLKIIRAMHRYAIGRPLELARQREFRSKQMMFVKWKTWWMNQAFLKTAARELCQFRVNRVVKKWIAIVNDVRHQEREYAQAAAFRERCMKDAMIRLWKSFVISKIQTNDAGRRLESLIRTGAFRSWQLTYSQHQRVRMMETQYESVLAQRCWRGFLRAIKSLQESRRAWLDSLSRIRLRKAVSMWRALVSMQKTQRMQAELKWITHQHSICQRVLSVWAQAVVVSAFLAVCAQKRASRVQHLVFQSWRIQNFSRLCRRKAKMKAIRRGLAALRSNALVNEARRELGQRSMARLLRLGWQTWRVEYRIHRSLQNEERTRLLDAFLQWRQSIQAQQQVNRCFQRLHQSQAVHTQGLKTRRSTFEEAMLLQSRVLQQRETVTRIIHAWHLAAKTRQRGRARSLSWRTAKSSHNAFLTRTQLFSCSDETHFDAEYVSDKENIHPNAQNTPSTTSRPTKRHERRPIQRSRREQKTTALEFWATQLLCRVFYHWKHQSRHQGQRRQSTPWV